MPGSVEERAPNCYRLRYDAPPDPLTGGRRQKVLTLHGTTRRQAERKLAELVADSQRGLLSDPCTELLRDYLPRWLESMRPSWRHRTYMSHSSGIRHLAKALGHLPIGKLSPQHVQGWYATCGLNPPAARQYGRYLSEAMRTAVEWDLIPKNPCERAKPPRDDKADVTIPPAEMLRGILLAVEDSWLRLPVLLAMTVGLRAGEVVALRWADIDLGAGTLTVARQRTRGAAGWCYAPPKTRKGRRTIPIGPGVVALLTEHRERQNHARALAGEWWHEEDLVICQGDGQPFAPDSISRRWQTLLRRAKLPHMRFHVLRHAAASYALAGGADVASVSRRLGHSGPNITLSLYAHLVPGVLDRAAAVADQVLGDVRGS